VVLLPRYRTISLGKWIPLFSFSEFQIIVLCMLQKCAYSCIRTHTHTASLESPAIGLGAMLPPTRQDTERRHLLLHRLGLMIRTQNHHRNWVSPGLYLHARYSESVVSQPTQAIPPLLRIFRHDIYHIRHHVSGKVHYLRGRIVTGRWNPMIKAGDLTIWRVCEMLSRILPGPEWPFVTVSIPGFWKHSDGCF
jgi:hypothetical protein